MATPTFFIKQNDNRPSLSVSLRDDKDRSVDVTGATVLFHMRNAADDSVTINGGAVDIVDAARGNVRYSWVVANTATAGAFEGEFQVTFADGTIQTFPNDGYIKVVITDDVV